MDDGFWVYHKNRFDLSSIFSHPEDKLWVVVRESSGENLNFNPADRNPKSMLDRGTILTKNSVIKMGRVRLRVQDIDY